MEEFEPFSLQTCESSANQARRPSKFSPSEGKPFAPFEIHDPFGLRAAIVPVLRQDVEGRMYGTGTAFHADGFGRFLTAHHVIDYTNERLPSRPILFLSMDAVVYGTVAIPPDCFVPVARADMPSFEIDDPLAALRGEQTRQTIDLASLTTEPIGPQAPTPQTLPLRLSGWTPEVGEIVLALGFPGLDLSEVDEHAQTALLTEGMFGAYGRIVEVHPEGVSASNRTPVFGVESDWPPGMSGGPVFNRAGEVVGVVSRSLRAESGLIGVGYAAHLGLIPDAPKLASALDMCNPGWRYCWGVVTEDASKLHSLYLAEEEANAAAARLNMPCEVRRLSNRIGTDDYTPDPQ